LSEAPNEFFAGVPAGVLESAAAMVFAVEEVPKRAFDGRVVDVSDGAFENMFERGVRGVVDVPKLPPNIEVVGLAVGVDGLGVDGGFDPNPVNGVLLVCGGVVARAFVDVENVVFVDGLNGFAVADDRDAKGFGFFGSSAVDAPNNEEVVVVCAKGFGFGGSV